MKIERNLSGLYFYTPEHGKTKCFEDLEEEQQDEIIERKGTDVRWLKEMIKYYANLVNEIAEEFDIRQER